MPYADPDRQREYQRNYQRQRRSGSTDGTCVDLDASVKVRTAADLLALLETVITEVREAEADVLAKARCIGYLATVTLKAIENSNLESRLNDIEEALRKGGR